MIQWLQKPWPWYIGGPLIGLMVPVLLIIGNKAFGLSSSLRHICAACIPAKIPFFQYNWKKESWNLLFAAGILIGASIVAVFFKDPAPMQVNPTLLSAMGRYGIHDDHHLLPTDLFNWPALHTLKGWILTLGGGFLVGFGTRYAGGCTSGHSIMGLSNLQWPSLIATCSFMAGGFLMANCLLPFILRL